MTTSTFSQTNLYDLNFNDVQGNSRVMAEFKGKKILIVNTASECGFTRQYKELQAVHEKFGDQLIVIGFPANNFGGQEPGTNKEIQAFCQKNFGVTFLIAEKISVTGSNIHPIFKWLCEQATASFSGEINWNFEKFLIDEKGELIERFRSAVEADSDDIVGLIEN